MTGGALVMHGRLVEIARRHEVSLATLAGPDPEEERALASVRESGVDVHAVWRREPSGFRRWARYGRVAAGWARGSSPLRTLWFQEPDMQRSLDRLLAERPVDLVQVEDNAMAVYRYRTDAPRVLAEHEVVVAPPPDFLRRGTPAWVRKPVLAAETARWCRYQKRVWRGFDRIHVFTDRDASAIAALAPDVAGRVRVNPFGVVLLAEPDPALQEPGTVLFVGGFLHPPNVEAALWLADDIMPRLRALHPGVRLVIVGSDPPARVRALEREDVRVTGRVPSVRSFLERAAVVVAPLRAGGGMRLKVLQAMVLGKAVVTTTLGTEGLALGGATPPVVVANDAGDIAQATASLLSSERARRELGRRARAFVVDHHSWPAHGRRLEALYAEIVPAHAEPAGAR
jgi:glycosyltransferase involved in cell wall biosynthesis